jgi:branched-chain amino acid aminotransferase
VQDERRVGSLFPHFRRILAGGEPSPHFFRKKVIRLSIAYFEGEFRPLTSVSIPVTDMALQRGVGVFDSLRTLGGKPLALGLHLDRLESSLRDAGISEPAPREEIEAVIREGIARMGEETSIRIYVTGGDRQEGGVFPAPRWFALFEPIHRLDPSTATQGVTLWPLPHERPLPLLKSINYMAAFVEKGLHPESFEVLYCPAGEITEATSSNAFMVIDGKIVTAPLERVLSGVTRTFVLETAREAGYRVEERCPKVDELPKAAEFFITGSVKEIVPVVKVGSTRIGDGRPGPVTRHLTQILTASLDRWVE